MRTYNYAGSQPTYSPRYGLILPGNNTVSPDDYAYFDQLVIAWDGTDSEITLV